MSQPSNYAFPGLAPFIDAAAARLGYGDDSLRHRVKTDWFINQASNALGNACFQRLAADTQDSIDRAVAIRDAWAMALDGMDAAIVEAAAKLGLPEPPFARKPEVIPHGPRKLRRTEHPGE